MSAAPVLDVRDIVVRFGGVRAVQGVSLQVGEKEVVGLIGPNAAGKSSLLGALGGQLPTAAGQVWLAGHDITTAPPYRRARVGLARTFQHTSTFDSLTVYENLLVSALRAEGSRLWGSLQACTRAKDSGVSIIIVEHALEVVQAVCDRVVVMASGQSWRRPATPRR